MSAVFIQPVQLAAGQAMTIDFIGTSCYFRQSDTTQDLIEIRPDTQQGILQLLPGQGFGFDWPVKRWIVKNIGATNIALGQLVIADGDYRDQRVVGSMSVVGTANVAVTNTPTVSVADAAKARVLAANSFMGANSMAASGAGTFSRVSLWNPATNPNRLIVQAVALSNVDMANPAMASLQSISAQPSLTFSKFGASKKFGGAASVAMTTVDTPGTPGGAWSHLLETPAQQQKNLVLTDPIVVPPGFGLAVWALQSNVAVSAAFEWYEEPNV